VRVDIETASANGTHPVVAVQQTYATEIVSAGMAFSAATYEKSTLTLREFEGARARTAEINGCLICQRRRSARDLHDYFDNFGGSYEESVATNGPAPDEEFYQQVSNWRTYPGFSEREALAIRYAEGLGVDPLGIAQDEEFWDHATAVFTDNEIVDLSYCVAAWMGLGRVTHALGLDTACILAFDVDADRDDALQK